VGSWRGFRHDGSPPYRSSSFMPSNSSSVTVGVMSDYTHLNLKDAEDQAPNFGLSPDLEFRMARVPLGLEHSGISYCRVSPGFRLPFGHKHKNQEEIYVLVSGGAPRKIEDEVRALEPWDAVRVHKDSLRSMEAGDEGAVFLIVGAPNTGPGDAEMVQEWWSD
jgi:mannose-6-phosphate isomerase-like protein (cupin superfamily)